MSVADVASTLNERQRRIWAAAEAKELGHGGISTVRRATGVSRRAIHIGLCELANDRGASVGIDHDTAEFAVASIRRWWRAMGTKRFPHAARLLITADSGGSNGARSRLWKVALQRFADETGLEVSVCHFPPGTSKWNKIEHRLFCQITRNWRGQPLLSREIIVQLIGRTTTQAGLKVKASLDRRTYVQGIKITDGELSQVRLHPAAFHGDWNYAIRPPQPKRRL
jgi:hypothetical protein